MVEGMMLCIYCGKSFISEKYMSHPCIEIRRPVKDIVIDFTYETETEDGDKTIHAYDLKGNIYWLTKPNPTKLAKLKAQTSDASKQEDYADWARRQHPNWDDESHHPEHGTEYMNRIYLLVGRSEGGRALLWADFLCISKTR